MSQWRASCSVIQACLKRVIFLPQPPPCLDYKCEPLAQLILTHFISTNDEFLLMSVS